jgi:hypothetical protein
VKPDIYKILGIKLVVGSTYGTYQDKVFNHNIILTADQIWQEMLSDEDLPRILAEDHVFLEGCAQRIGDRAGFGHLPESSLFLLKEASKKVLYGSTD